tara:strand:+ start:1828 stop:2157 length:330 start_codon:yes stop_codon:yes gene_type:complete
VDTDARAHFFDVRHHGSGSWGCVRWRAHGVRHAQGSEEALASRGCTSSSSIAECNIDLSGASAIADGDICLFGASAAVSETRAYPMRRKMARATTTVVAVANRNFVIQN